ncbi:hypothetical protein MMPV_008268 [Pyropia vietnamensis]
MTRRWMVAALLGATVIAATSSAVKCQFVPPAPAPALPVGQPYPAAPLPGQFPPLPPPAQGGQNPPAPGQGPGRPLPIGPGGPATIAAIIAAADGFAVLGEALEASGLLAALGHPGAVLTVFAPTDAAFVRLARTLGYVAASDDPTPVFNFLITTLTRMGGGNPLPLLQRILSYHILTGRQGTRDLAGNTVRTVEGGLIAVRPWLRIIDLAPAVRQNAQIAPGDIGASNGVVHVIDAVLLPFPICPVNRVGYCRAIGARLDQRTCSCVRN